MREFLQFFTFLVSLGIVIVSFYNLKKRKESYWYLFIIFGILGCVFYVLIMSHIPQIHEYSALVRTVQSSIVVGWSAGILLGRRG